MNERKNEKKKLFQENLNRRRRTVRCLLRHNPTRRLRCEVNEEDCMPKETRRIEKWRKKKRKKLLKYPSWCSPIGRERDVKNIKVSQEGNSFKRNLLLWMRLRRTFINCRHCCVVNWEELSVRRWRRLVAESLILSNAVAKIYTTENIGYRLVFQIYKS